MGASQTSPAQPRLYFVNAVVDFALIGGISIAAYLLLRAFHDGARTDVVWTIGAWLAWVINWPHFSATSYRLYHQRRNIRQYPVTALVVPVLIATAAIGAFASPQGVAPWLVKFFVIWSPYHFSGQSLGLSLIYARRAGFKVGRWERLALSGFIFSTFLVQSSIAETGRGDNEFYSVAVPLLGLPLWVPVILRIWMGLCGAAVLFFAIRWSIRQRRILPPIVLLPALSQFVWFVPGATLASFNEFVPMFHSLQYLLVAWLVQLKERLDISGSDPSRRYVLKESGRWAIINLAGGIFLFWLLPRLGERTGATFAFSTAIVLSAVQIHHFFVDGVIWKLKDPRVASPLLANVRDLQIKKPPAPSEQSDHEVFVKRLLAIVLALVVPCVPFASAQPPVDAIRVAEQRVLLRTNVGDIVIAFYPDVAPKHVAQILKLVQLGVYDSSWFHRVEPGFVVQLSDAQNRRQPLSSEQRAALQKLPAEFSHLRHQAGVLSMARRDGEPDSAESSFSFLLADAPHLDGKYTIFGKLEWGADVLAAIAASPRDAKNKPLVDVVVRAALVKTGAEIHRMQSNGELRGPQDERILLRTNRGDLVLSLYPDEAPQHVAQILKLVRLGVYDSTWFFRVQPGFLVQLSDAQNRRLPLSSEQRAAIRTLPLEVSDILHTPGVATMALRAGDQNSAETSFSLLLAPAPQLDGKYTVFGKLVWGTDVLTAIAASPRGADEKPREETIVQTAAVKTGVEIERMKALGELRKAGSYGGPDGGTLPGPPPSIITSVGIAIMVALSVLAFFLSGRVSPERVSAFSILTVLVGAFLLMREWFPRVRGNGLLATLLFSATVALFKLMNRFESARPQSAAGKTNAPPRPEEPPSA